MQLRFQTALVTGSSRGFGRQIAVKLAMGRRQENRGPLSDRKVRGCHGGLALIIVWNAVGVVAWAMVRTEPVSFSISPY